MFLFRQFFVNRSVLIIGLLLGAQNIVKSCEACESGTTMTGDYQFSGNICVAHTLATNAFVACDVTLPICIDFADTNSFVVREKSGDQILDVLALAPAGITAFKNVSLQNNLVINGNVTQGIGSKLGVLGAKVFDTALTNTTTTALTVNFSQNSGAALVHIMLFGETGTGDLTYEAWIFLGTGNSSVKSWSSDVTAGPTPTVTIDFNASAGTANFSLVTGVGESIINPYMFYEVYGNKISSIV